MPMDECVRQPLVLFMIHIMARSGVIPHGLGIVSAATATMSALHATTYTVVADRCLLLCRFTCSR